MPEQMNIAARQLNDYVASSQSGKKVFYGPLYSAVNLLGLCDANLVLQSQTIEFFQSSQGQNGQGFVNAAGQPRPLRLSETNLDGAPGQLPAGYSFLMTSVGLYMPPQLPPDIKDFLTRHTAIKNVRHSNVWSMGATQFWPCAEFGHQSKSVANNVANAQVQYGVNGAVGMRQFPKGGELYFPSKEVIKFTMETYEDLNCTTNGLPWNNIAFGEEGSNAPNPIDGLVIYIIGEGWRFESLSA